MDILLQRVVGDAARQVDADVARNADHSSAEPDRRADGIIEVELPSGVMQSSKYPVSAEFPYAGLSVVRVIETRAVKIRRGSGSSVW
jgi:hypothetical protein